MEGTDIDEILNLSCYKEELITNPEEFRVQVEII